MTEASEATQVRRVITTLRVLAAAALLVFAVLIVAVRGPTPTALDVAITRALQSATWLELPMRLVSIPGNALMPFVITTATVIALVFTRRRLEGAFLAASAGLGAALNTTIKHLVARPRPTAAHVLKLDFVDGFSFPSGHVAFYVCYFGFLAALARRSDQPPRTRHALTALAALPVALVPFSRMYLGAHWASDTVGALLWSSTWLGLVVTLYDAARLRRAQKPSAPAGSGGLET